MKRLLSSFILICVLTALVPAQSRIQTTRIDVSGRSSAPSVSPSGWGSIYFDRTSGKFKCSQNGGAYTDCVGGGGGAGTGDMVLADVQTVTGAKTFNSGKLKLGGSTSGAITLNAPAVAGTGTVVLPLTGTLATLAGSETFTNKTLTSPVINTPTGIVKGDVGLGNVDNTSDATKNAASVTLTNKTFALGSNTFSGTTAQFNTALSDNDFATLAGSETLTNKTLTTPTIASFANANHDHSNSAGGGSLGNSVVTNAMLAGSIAISKLSITGTPDGTKFLRDDGSWAAAGGGGGAGLTANTFTDTQTIALGTITDAKQALSITATWNDGAENFTAPLLVNVTNTASGAASLLTDFQLGGTSKFKVNKAGDVTFTGDITGNGFASAGGNLNVSGISSSGSVRSGGLFYWDTGPGLLMVNASTMKFVDSGFSAGAALQLPPKTATPSDPSSSSEGNIYIKGGKLIVQYNDAGTVRYKYLDLTSTGVTWTHATSAP